jgi:hypothetical protein
VVGGIVWRRANRWGALASMVTAMVVNFALYAATGQRLDHWDANVFLAALLAGIAALIVVSLATAPEPAGAIGSLFDRLDTSSDETRPAGGAHQPLLLVNVLRMRRVAAAHGWRVFREDLGGFTTAWILVIALVALTAVFLRL